MQSKENAGPVPDGLDHETRTSSFHYSNGKELSQIVTLKKGKRKKQKTSHDLKESDKRTGKT